MPTAVVSPLVSPEEHLVAKHHKLAMWFANRFRARAAGAGLDVEDLEQVARLALWQAARKHDPAGGGRFQSYAGVAIRRALLDAVERNRPWQSLPADAYGTPVDVEDPRPAGMEVLEGSDVLTRLLKVLTVREKELVRLKYGIDCRRPWTEGMLCHLYGGITRQTVHSRLRGALAKMQRAAGARGIGPDSLVG